MASIISEGKLPKSCINLEITQHRKLPVNNSVVVNFVGYDSKHTQNKMIHQFNAFHMNSEMQVINDTRDLLTLWQDNSWSNEILNAWELLPTWRRY